MQDIRQTRVNTFVESQLDDLAEAIERKLDADVMAIVGPIYGGIDDQVREAVESRQNKRDKLAVVLDTGGGIIEVVERMVNTIRYHYPKEVIVIVPDRAMSAGTVFAMSGDRIMMDYYSCLGPIDPQLQRDDKLVPALSYLVQYERLKEISASGDLTPAEAILLQKLDLAELHSFEEAKALSDSLLQEWLVKYKFKEWTVTETSKTTVTPEMRAKRALEIAHGLADHQRWHSHGRSISMSVLVNDLKLKIEDFGQDRDLCKNIRDYHQFLGDYMSKIAAYHFVHTKNLCLSFLWRSE